MSNLRVLSYLNILILAIGTLTVSHASIYYVNDISGSDANNGTSTGTAWKTLSKVNSTNFQANDSVLFIRGGQWRGQLVPKSGSVSGPVSYAAYGSGTKPLFLGSLSKASTGNWVFEGVNIWRSADTFSVDIGNIIFNNTTVFGKKKWTQGGLMTQGDYYFKRTSGTRGVVRIYSSSNPGSYYSGVELAQRIDMVNFQNVSYAKFENLALKYGAAHGFGGGNTHHITIRACDISYIGGGDLNQDGTNIRFGNGIEFWGSAHDNLVERCLIYEIYDTGLTNQNHTTAVSQYNIYYFNNAVYNCALASYEYWNKPSTSTTANIRFENNTCAGAGSGWGIQRPDLAGAHVILSYNEAKTDSIFIRNNIFYKARVSLFMPSTWRTTDNYDKLVLKNNLYYQTYTSDTIVYLFYSTAYTSSTFSNYKSATGQDSNSIVSDPLFVNAAGYDYHITSFSPAMNAGNAISYIVKDFDDQARTPASNDIGADEYQ